MVAKTWWLCLIGTKRPDRERFGLALLALFCSYWFKSRVTYKSGILSDWVRCSQECDFSNTTRISAGLCLVSDSAHALPVVYLYRCSWPPVSKLLGSCLSPAWLFVFCKRKVWLVCWPNASLCMLLRPYLSPVWMSMFCKGKFPSSSVFVVFVKLSLKDFDSFRCSGLLQTT